MAPLSLEEQLHRSSGGSVKGYVQDLLNCIACQAPLFLCCCSC